jgi:hypothetical protein
MALASCQIALQPGRVQIAQMWGHERRQGFTEEFFFGEAERLLSGKVEFVDQPVLIDRDNRIGGGVDNVAVSFFAFPQGCFYPLALGDFAFQATGTLRQIRRAAP